MSRSSQEVQHHAFLIDSQHATRRVTETNNDDLGPPTQRATWLVCTLTETAVLASAAFMKECNSSLHHVLKLNSVKIPVRVSVGSQTWCGCLRKRSHARNITHVHVATTLYMCPKFSRVVTGVRNALPPCNAPVVLRLYLSRCCLCVCPGCTDCSLVTEAQI